MVHSGVYYEIIPQRLLFLPVGGMRSIQWIEGTYLTTDHSRQLRLGLYFGPPCIADIYNYSTSLKYIINNSKTVIVWSSYTDIRKYTNAVFLMGTFLMLVMKMKPNQVIDVILPFGINKILSYRDATQLKRGPTLQMIYFFRALYKAIKLKWFTLETFDLKSYNQLSNFYLGDMNWIIPGKLLALSCPFRRKKLTRDQYVKVFKKLNIVALVQLNGWRYDKSYFEYHGIKHYNLYFPDGTAPNRAIVKRFLQIARCSDGAIAIHCKAGIGRTGTLIAAYIIKYFKMCALEATAWTRLCRPGSVFGLQQHFLKSNEHWFNTTTIVCSNEVDQF